MQSDTLNYRYKAGDDSLTRCDIVDRFLPCIYAGEKVSKEYFSGIYFIGKFGYLLGKGMIGRIKADDRILPAEPLEWKNGEVLPVSEEVVNTLRNVNFRDYNRPIFVRKKDMISLFPEKMTPKRKSKSTVILDFYNRKINGTVIRKNEIISKKIFSEVIIPKKHDNDYYFEGQIQINLFDFEKFVLEIIQEYDIIGVQLPRSKTRDVLFSCHRMDKTKPMIDFILKEGSKTICRNGTEK